MLASLYRKKSSVLKVGQYLLSTVETSLEDLLSLGILSYQAPSGARSPSRSLRLEISKSYQILLPEAIRLTDAFGYSDWELDRYAPLIMLFLCFNVYNDWPVPSVSMMDASTKSCGEGRRRSPSISLRSQRVMK